MRVSAEPSLRGFRAPKFWGHWVLWGALHVVARLPFGFQLALGQALGSLAWHTMRRQRRIARRNLDICFPELDADKRQRLLRRHFTAIGMSFIEMGIGWFASSEQLRSLVKINGWDHIERAMAAGNGVLLFGAHCTSLEVGVTILEPLRERCAFMFRPQRNAMMDTMIRRGRSRFARDQIARDDVRALLKRLKDGFVVVYLPDQTYLGNQSAILPFFGEPAVTNTATTKLARIADAKILTFFYRRRGDTRGYEVDIGPPPQGVPSDDEIEDTRRLFTALEAHIRVAPEQYLWTYKKFKRRPAELGDPYRELE
jgi:KDO2-lipid IV(A) lauroyltransferase